MDGKRRWIVALAALLGVLIFIIYLATRERLSDEEQIRRLCIQAEKDADTKNARALLSIVSKDYRDEQGFNYSLLRALLWDWRRSTLHTDVTVYNLQVQVHGRRARVSALVTVQMDTTTTSRIPFAAELVKEKRRWKVVSTSGWHGSYLDLDS